MKKVLALAVALAAIATGYGIYLLFPGGPVQLHIATEGAYPPFNAIDKDGNLIGFDVDIAEALCDRMHVVCTMEAQAWDGIIPGLLDRKYDVIVASMSITEKRRDQVNFTDKYYSTSARFVARKSAKIEISDAGLAGKRVGVQRATVFETYLRAKFPQAVPVLYDTQENANADMADGKLDLLLADWVQLSQDFLKTDKGQDFEFTGPPLVDPAILGEGAGIAVRKEDTQLLAALNKALKAIREDGTYKRLNDKYFDFDIYGN
jgi:arginine/ornithine transport system substrate-binding protein